MIPTDKGRWISFFATYSYDPYAECNCIKGNEPHFIWLWVKTCFPRHSVQLIERRGPWGFNMRKVKWFQMPGPWVPFGNRPCFTIFHIVLSNVTPAGYQQAFWKCSCQLLCIKHVKVICIVCPRNQQGSCRASDRQILAQWITCTRAWNRKCTWSYHTKQSSRKLIQNFKLDRFLEDALVWGIMLCL